MKKISERTFGTRVTNAQQLATLVAGFTNYQALLREASLEYFNNLIDAVKTSNTETAAGKQALSLFKGKRDKLFKRHAQSVEKLLSPIATAVRSQYGLISKEATDIAHHIKNIRGDRGSKQAVLKTIDGKDVVVKQVSTSHRSTGSITQLFADVLAAIGELKPAYSPLNKELAMDKLQQKYAELQSTADEVTSGHAKWLKAKTARNSQYEQLLDSAKSIKESVKALYGAASSEYISIKSIAI